MIEYNPDTVKEWIESRFDSVRIAPKSGEYYVNSIFTHDDNGHHLYINPVKGVYQCKKSSKSGTLIDLVKLIDNCSWEDAKELVAGNDLRQMEKRLEKFFNDNPVVKPKVLTGLPFPPNTFPIQSLSSITGTRNKVINYLVNRKLPIHDLYYCTTGEYADRIIIPYWYNDTVRYWNGRYIGHRLKAVRYRGPDGTCGVGKSDVVFYPKKTNGKGKIYLTEGEFDSISLSLCGLPTAAIGGKELSTKQMAELFGYTIVLAFDTDKAGRDAVIKSVKELESYGFKDLYRVCCPEHFKDWNEMFISNTPKDIVDWIKTNEKPTDYFKLVLDSLF